MTITPEQQFELDQFKREIELKKPIDLLQFGANYFNKKLEIQRNFIKNQEDLALTKGIVLFPPMSQHNSISIPPSSRLSVSFRSSSHANLLDNSTSNINTNKFIDDNSDPISKSNSNININASPRSQNKTPVATFNDNTNSGINFKTTFDSNISNSSLNDNSNDNSNIPTTSSSFSDNIFKGGFNVGQESSKKRINSPLDPSEATNKKFSPVSTPVSTPLQNAITSANNNNTHLDPNDPSASSINNIIKPTTPVQATMLNTIQNKDLHNDEIPLPSRFNANRRTSVSGETLQPDNFEDWTPDHYVEKTDEQLKRLETFIGKNFLFNKLDSDSKKLVINCLEERHIEQNDIIIKQGDEGDYFYVVESGTVEFYVNNNKVNTSGPGSSFGELALMYNNPRAATVIATTDCILWALDRMTFRKILLGSSFKKRVMYDDLLKTIPILKSLNPYERSKVADALDTQFFEPNEIIIKEGDVGENFYLIEYGDVDVIKKKEGIVNKLTKGDYFGEIALLNDLPRQATIKTVTKTKVATLGKSGFQRLLGPVVRANQ